MRSQRKHIYLVLFLIGFVLMLLVGAAGALFGFAYNTDEVFGAPNVVLEMKVGESLDLNEYCGDWNDLVYLYGDGGTWESIDAAKNNLFLDGEGRLHAKKSGVYRFELRGGRLFFSELLRETIKSFCLIVYDADHSDYMPVPTYSELRRGVSLGERKFIQTGNFILSDRDTYDLFSFDGILVNPHGYEISIRDDLPLFYQIGGNAIVSGLRVNDGGEGFRPTAVIKTENGSTITKYGMLALSGIGAIVDCSVEADIHSNVYLEKDTRTEVAGIVGGDWPVEGTWSPDSAILRCSFTGNGYSSGTWYDEIRNVFGIIASTSDSVVDCTVRADLYPREGLSPVFACTLYHMPLRGIHDYYECTAIDARGNRVFDRSGDHEVDFSKPVTYTIKYKNMMNNGHAEGYAGAIVPRDPTGFFDEKSYLFSVTDSGGNSYPTDEPLYFGEKDTALQYEFRYKQTEFHYRGDNIFEIYAAQEVIVLPAGSVIGHSLRLGACSPADITFVFEGDAEISGYYGSVMPENEGFTVSVDFTDSDVYYYASDGSVLREYEGETMLCEFGGDPQAGMAVLPAEATLMNADPFGGRPVGRLYTNNVKDWLGFVGDWRDTVKELRFGAAFNLNKDFEYFSSLEKISLDAREDGFHVSGGMLYKDRANEAAELVAAPRRLAPGGEIAVENCIVSANVLYRNEAKKVTFRNVSAVEYHAAQEALFEEVVFEGTVECIVRSNAFADCQNLRSFTAEEGAEVSLESMALSGEMENFKTLTLTNGFGQVAYDAVSGNPAFEGYELAAGCNKFAVVNGLLFEGGNVRIPAAWKGGTLAVPDGITSLYVTTDAGERFIDELILGKDISALTLNNVRFRNIGINGQNAAFAVKDGVLYTADMRTLVLFPSSRTGTFEVPDTVETIAPYAFFGSSVYVVHLPAGLTEIGAYAFADSELTGIEIPAGVLQIGENAFESSRLSTAAIGEGIAELKTRTFAECYFLESIVLPESLQTVGRYAFFHCYYLEEAQLPAGLTEIGPYAFAQCYDLRTAELPAPLVSVGDYAFAGTALETLHLGVNVQTVGEGAFGNCRSLQTVAAENDATLYGAGAFAGTPVSENPAYRHAGGIYFGNAFVQPYEDADVLAIREGTKSISPLDGYTIRRVTVPASAEKIAQNAFSDFTGAKAEEVRFQTPLLGDIYLIQLRVVVPVNVQYTGTPSGTVFYYSGTEEDYEANGRPLSRVSEEDIYFYSASRPASGGNYWHYENGEIAVWP